MRVLLMESLPRPHIHQNAPSVLSTTMQAEKIYYDVFFSHAECDEAVSTVDYAAVIAEHPMADGSTIDWLRRRRARGFSTPVLIVLKDGRAGAETRLAALEAGADDCVCLAGTSPREIVARVRALLRRPSSLTRDVLEVGDLVLDVTSRTITRMGQPIPFPRREFGVLELLMRRCGRVVSRASLEASLYGHMGDVCPNSIDVRISRVRHRLRACGSSAVIRTVRGIGYVINAERPHEGPAAAEVRRSAMIPMSPAAMQLDAGN